MVTIISWWSWHRDDPYYHEVVMTLFSCHFGVLMGGFWKHFGLILKSKIVLEALWTLCSCRKSIFSLRLTPFWMRLPTSWRGFSATFIDMELVVDFSMIFTLFMIDFSPFWYAKIITSLHRGCKITVSTLLLSNAYSRQFWVFCETGLTLILDLKCPSEASWKANVIKYAYWEGSESFGNLTPPKIFGSRPPVGAI